MPDTSANTGSQLLTLTGMLSIAFCPIPNSPHKVQSIFVNLTIEPGFQMLVKMTNLLIIPLRPTGLFIPPVFETLNQQVVL